PFFPNIGFAHVVLFGTLLIAQFVFVSYLVRSGRFRRQPEGSARLIFAIDLGLIAYAIFLFSYDPNWTTYIVGFLVVIAGGFRFATAGAVAATVAMAATYVLSALYRERVYGYATEPQRLVFTVCIYVISGFLMIALLRELATLRAQREAFENQRAETEALRHLDRMKSDFLAEMSHDFRSPITVVRGALELLLSERPGPLRTEQRGLAERADRNVKRLEEFSEDLLEMARIEHGSVALDRVEIDACALVREVVDDQRSVADLRGQSIQVRCRDEHITILADVGRLRRAIGNLIANAIKYGPERSPIVVQTLREAGTFTVRVTDDGPGVAPDERDRIFEKFSRGRRSAAVAGAGLGLAIARSLAELHGGTVRYEDAEGGGASFVLSVPVGFE
ncbi:MAG TPA: HAMP domain-containing sensor histidine kinase, partial [Candidatus Acidoferrales bacterium]|nr:HAMP domain-containing sensor histidine kinase [Candidatus Acidoferrales bacterium]